MWTKIKCKKNNEGRKKRKIKGGALMSWFWPWEMWDHPHGLNALQERCTLFIQALKQFPHAGSMKMKMKRGKPGLQYKLERAFTYVHTSAINPSNENSQKHQIHSVEDASPHCSLSSDHSSTNCFYSALNKKEKFGKRGSTSFDHMEIKVKVPVVTWQRHTHPLLQTPKLIFE